MISNFLLQISRKKKFINQKLYNLAIGFRNLAEDKLLHNFDDELEFKEAFL